MTAEPVLEARDLRRRYGDTVALDGVSVTVEAGEVFGLVGPNGAGKTTLVRALTGTTSVEGTVRLFGVEPTAVDRSRVGLLPQEFAPAGRLTVRELLAYYAGLYEEARSVESVLDDVGLVEAADTWYEDLSGGQKRRACVGAALVNDPELLFLDEPTSGLDPRASRTVRDTLASLGAGDTTVFLSTHILPVVDELADVVGVLADGRLVAEGPPEQLKTRAAAGDQRTLEDVFLDVTGDVGDGLDVAGGGDDSLDVAGEDSDGSRNGSQTGTNGTTPNSHTADSEQSVVSADHEEGQE